MDKDRPVLTIGLSGSSSAGKTTLCSLLQSILPALLSQSNTKLLFLHCDAYCKEFDELPSAKSGVLDADSNKSIHFDRLVSALDYIRTTGTYPPDYQRLDFIEDDLRNAERKLDPAFIERMRTTIANAGVDWSRYSAVAVVDGFLLYHDEELRRRLDVKILLRTSMATAKIRRLGRYRENAAAEGSDEFWKTESYFDECVWPNYVLNHSFLFPKGDVEKDVDGAEIARRWGVIVAPKIDMDIESTLSWAVEVLIAAVRRSKT